MGKRLSKREHRENLLSEYNNLFLFMMGIIASMASLLVAMIAINIQVGVASIIGGTLAFLLLALTIYLAWQFKIVAAERDRIGKELGIPETLKRIGASEKRENSTNSSQVRRKEQPLWSDSKLKKEEVRGIFAIGVIVVLISIRVYLSDVEFLLPAYFGLIKLSQLELFDSLILLWTLYILFTALALADEVLISVHPKLKRFSELSMDFAHAFFVIGIFLLIAVAIGVFWPIIFLLIILYIASWIRARRSK